MKKTFLTFLNLLVLASFAFGGGIVTNTNQSAAWVRMPVRDASTSIDAVYFNPAGLVHLENGFHFSVSNQTISQNKTIENSYPYLNEAKYIGDVAAPLFPSVYAAYKKDKWAFSLGFNPIGGGGGAKYETGLPSFETDISNLVPLLNPDYGVTAYSADIYFEGTSIFWGLQAGVSYAINDMFSVYAGGRYVMAKNTYDGHVKDIMINPGGGTEMTRADAFFTTLATNATYMASAYQDTANTYYTLAENTTDPTLQAAYTDAGDQYQAGADQYSAGAAEASASAEQTADKKVKAEQTGSGFAPVLGFNIHTERFNLGVKYEFKTPLELTNETTTDDVGMFPDGVKTHSDMPAMLSIGATYKILPDFKASIGGHYYFDKNVDWDGREDLIDKNFYEIGVGLEYDINEKLSLSGGWLYAATGVTVGYQTDMSYSLSSNSIGFGGHFDITPSFSADLGFMTTMYENGKKELTYDGIGTFDETYQKETFIISLGLNFRLGAGSADAE